MKENIATTTTGLDALMRLSVRDFAFIADPTRATTTGFIAQELYDVFPWAVTTNGDNGFDALGASSSPWSVDYGRITPLLAKSIQDLNLKLEGLATSTATSTDSASFTSRFFASLFARITEWFASATNGITDFFARRLHTQEICTTRSDGTEVCASGDQLAEILSASAAAGAPGSGVAGASDDDHPPSEEHAVHSDAELPTILDNDDDTATSSTEVLDPAIGPPANDNVPLDDNASQSSESSAEPPPIPEPANDNAPVELPTTGTGPEQ